MFLLSQIELFGATATSAQNHDDEGSVYEYWNGKDNSARKRLLQKQMVNLISILAGGCVLQTKRIIRISVGYIRQQVEAPVWVPICQMEYPTHSVWVQLLIMCLIKSVYKNSYNTLKSLAKLVKKMLLLSIGERYG